MTQPSIWKILIVLTATGALHADSLVCSANGVTQSFSSFPAHCNIPGVPAGTGSFLAEANVAPPTIDNGAFSLLSFADLLATPEDDNRAPITIVATWNDVFDLPASNPSDILRITWGQTGLGSGGTWPGSQITLSNGQSLTFVCPHIVGPPDCPPGQAVFRVPASAVTSVNLQGNYDPGPLNSQINNSITDELEFTQGVSIARYLADGVTPDPFTAIPEPRTLLLLGFGFAGCAVRWSKRKRIANGKR